SGPRPAAPEPGLVRRRGAVLGLGATRRPAPPTGTATPRATRRPDRGSPASGPRLARTHTATRRGSHRDSPTPRPRLADTPLTTNGAPAGGCRRERRSVVRVGCSYSSP